MTREYKFSEHCRIAAIICRKTYLFITLYKGVVIPHLEFFVQLHEQDNLFRASSTTDGANVEESGGNYMTPVVQAYEVVRSREAKINGQRNGNTIKL